MCGPRKRSGRSGHEVRSGRQAVRGCRGVQSAAKDMKTRRERWRVRRAKKRYDSQRTHHKEFLHPALVHTDNNTYIHSTYTVQYTCTSRNRFRRLPCTHPSIYVCFCPWLAWCARQFLSLCNIPLCSFKYLLCGLIGLTSETLSTVYGHKHEHRSYSNKRIRHVSTVTFVRLLSCASNSL